MSSILITLILWSFVEPKGYLGGDIKQADVYRSLVERSGS